MKRLVLLLCSIPLLLSSPFCCGQISYSALPMDSELVARDLKTNLGTIAIRGDSYNGSARYDSICIKLYRDTRLVECRYQALTYYWSVAPFSFLLQIPAELHEYRVSVSSIRKGVQKTDTTIYGIVAGDVFMIEGQSNALGMMRDRTSANCNKSEFIRVFGNSDSTAPGLMHNLKWFRGEGDGGFLENGHAGQWGLRLGRLLVDSMKIPVAIFNGASGGTPLHYYQPPSDSESNIATNYGRLNYRLTLTGLQNNVRAIIWSQGETDGINGTGKKKYMADFLSLEDAWKADYPGFKKIYIFQTRTDTTYHPVTNILAIEEAQRELADSDKKEIELMSTADLKNDSGHLHFEYKGGYELFANRIYALIARDIYGVTGKKELDAPMIKAAYLSDSTTLVVLENADSLLQYDKLFPIDNYSIKNYVWQHDKKGRKKKRLVGVEEDIPIDTIILNKNKILFKLSRYPGNMATITYPTMANITPHNWLTNTSGIEILSFYKYPITDSIPKSVKCTDSSFSVNCNPFEKKAVIYINRDGVHHLEVLDENGKKKKWVTFAGKQYQLITESLPEGSYTLRLFDNEMQMIGATRILLQ